MRRIMLFLITQVVLFGCNSIQTNLDKAEGAIEIAEQKSSSMTEEDWSELEMTMQKLETDLEQNRSKYNDEQVKEIGKLQGRYFAVAVKRGINDFQESLKDLGSQAEGFIEGIKSDTLN